MNVQDAGMSGDRERLVASALLEIAAGNGHGPAGMRAAHAIPVLGFGAAVGVLNLFRVSVGGLTAFARALGELAEDVVAGTAGITLPLSVAPLSEAIDTD